MTDEKVNANPEEKRASEAPAPAGLGDPSAPEHTGGRCYPLVRIRRLPPMLSLPCTMRERAVASLAWRRTAPPGQGISGISRQLRTGQSHSDSRPEKRAPERLPKAGTWGITPAFYKKHVFSTLYENKNRLSRAPSTSPP